MNRTLHFAIDVSPEKIVLRLKPGKRPLIDRLINRATSTDLENPPPDQRPLLMALADLKSLADARPDELSVHSDRIELSHRLASELDGNSAALLGLPPLVDLTLKTDSEGLIGSSNFKLRYEWSRNGVRQFPERIGALLKTSGGLRRLPLWMFEAIEVADNARHMSGDAQHWAALARFRQALDPGIQMTEASDAARVSMTDFLSGLRVKVADSFSISPNRGMDDFEIVPFDRRRNGELDEERLVFEAEGELNSAERRIFDERVAERGVLNAYRLAPGSFLVIDRAARPALEVMARMKKAPIAERTDFVRNPRPYIAEAVEAELARDGTLSGLSPDAQEQAIEAAAEPLFVETREFSERVIGIKVYQKLLAIAESSGTTWLPEDFARAFAEKLDAMSTGELDDLNGKVRAAIDLGEPSVSLDELEVPAKTETVDAIDDRIARLQEEAAEKSEPHPVKSGPIILDTLNNFDDVKWHSKHGPRPVLVSTNLPSAVMTPLKPHQFESFNWQIEAWKAGLPGILNADEQGLGKTLQTIAFLAWLKIEMAQAGTAERGPVLIVAPASLLMNWEAEVLRHTSGFGHLIRLYGSAIATRKRLGARGKDTDNGEAKLDFDLLAEAIEEGRAHRFWILTTYTTLANYQHSLRRIPFSAAVFDEIQAIKNPDSLRNIGASGMKVDFRIGLTGTPIENSAVDLWSIMDVLAPGSLGSLKDFRERYGSPTEVNMAELHDRLFKPSATHPPLAIRRIKDIVASDLPKKTRLLHPRAMPAIQADTYEDAKLKLAKGGAGAALKMLHHIRSVSVHPFLDGIYSDSEFVAASARLQATLALLRSIAAQNERVLVFIEHLKMQYRFIELVRAEFGLVRVDLINGATPIAKRQAIVTRFQEDGRKGAGFDLLVLGPKAAGTGLTLTAATHVIHLSRWWNPAVEEQCNDRVHRIGQDKPVTIHVPVAVHAGYREHSFDFLLHSLMQRKRRLAASALWPMGDTDADVGELNRLLESPETEAVGDPVKSAINATFLRDGQPRPLIGADGSVPFL